MRGRLSRMGIHSWPDAAALLLTVALLILALPALTDGLLGVRW